MRVRDPELNSKWGTICTPVEMIAPDGKRRKTQASDLEGIFRIIQSIPSKKAENRRIAKEGGNVAKEARQTMERRLGRSVISPDKASDYLLPNNEEDKE